LLRYTGRVRGRAATRWASQGSLIRINSASVPVVMLTLLAAPREREHGSVAHGRYKASPHRYPQ
jgi:hypothetical protein